MEEKLKIIVDAIQSTNGYDIIIYDFTSINPFIDRVVLCDGDNQRQVYALANNIRDALKTRGYDVKHFEGNKESKWILLDVDDIIVHVFLDEERHFYALEKLYADLARLEQHYDL
ncbi:MAG: ribosome silencing factor [Breznakia sp.]